MTDRWNVRSICKYLGDALGCQASGTLSWNRRAEFHVRLRRSPVASAADPNVRLKFAVGHPTVQYVSLIGVVNALATRAAFARRAERAPPQRAESNGPSDLGEVLKTKPYVKLTARSRLQAYAAVTLRVRIFTPALTVVLWPARTHAPQQRCNPEHQLALHVCSSVPASNHQILAVGARS
jgi:hypothetical protein